MLEALYYKYQLMLQTSWIPCGWALSLVIKIILWSFFFHTFCLCVFLLGSFFLTLLHSV